MGLNLKRTMVNIACLEFGTNLLSSFWGRFFVKISVPTITEKEQSHKNELSDVYQANQMNGFFDEDNVNPDVNMNINNDLHGKNQFIRTQLILCR